MKTPADLLNTSMAQLLQEIKRNGVQLLITNTCDAGSLIYPKHEITDNKRSVV